MAEFTPASIKQLNTLQPQLSAVLTLAKKWSDKVDWQISQGARTIEQQQAYFDSGASRINPQDYPDRMKLYAVAKHITGPGMPASRAADIFVPGQEGGSFNLTALAYVQGIIKGAACSLGVNIRSGLDFDEDGKLAEKGTFIDGPHVELD